MQTETTVPAPFKRLANSHLEASFQLNDQFIESYVNREVSWSAIGFVVFKRTYARPLESVYPRYQQLAEKYNVTGTEEWWLTVTRVVEGVYRTQEKHCKYLHLPWSYSKAQKSAQEMYELIFTMKFLPPGRGLWAMGTEYVDTKTGMPLSNCAFISTENIDQDFSKPFCFLMDASMLGVGVGFDTLGAGKVAIVNPLLDHSLYEVEDSREGWVALIKQILEAYTGLGKLPANISYDRIRPAGELIRGFGGVAPGPGPLKELVVELIGILQPLANVGGKVTSATIVDIFNYIGKCVVAGNTRRSAELALGSVDDEEYLSLKDPDTNKEALYSRRWASNNSVVVTTKSDYSKVAEMTAKNGEPGYFWMDNAKAYGRMKDPPDWKDEQIRGLNPCAEITLNSFELCCLVETFPAKHSSYEEFERTLKFAYLYVKTVTLIPTHNRDTNAVMLKNRRVGTSISGITQAISRHGLNNFMNWCDNGYVYLKKLDRIYSNWLCIPKSIKLTTTKPSGSVSLLNSSTPGIHFPHSKYYHRVVRMATTSQLVKDLSDRGYTCIEIPNEPNTTAVYFPVMEEYFDRAKEDVTMWEQLELAAQVQYYWADNAVSISVSFKPEEAKDIERALELYGSRLKSVSFIPYADHKYEHAPYQKISEEEYLQAVSKIKKLDKSQVGHEVTERFCSNDSCTI